VNELRRPLKQGLFSESLHMAKSPQVTEVEIAISTSRDFSSDVKTDRMIHHRDRE
jgi:hypothetical protein